MVVFASLGELDCGRMLPNTFGPSDHSHLLDTTRVQLWAVGSVGRFDFGFIGDQKYEIMCLEDSQVGFGSLE